MLATLLLSTLLGSSQAYRYYTLSGNDLSTCDPQWREREMSLELDSGFVHGIYVKFKQTISLPEATRTMCSFKVVPPQGYGVLVTLQKMSMASAANGTCLESIQFSDEEKPISDSICGGNDIKEIRNWWTSTYKTPSTMHVDMTTMGTRRLNEKSRRDVSIEMSFVAYSKCLNGRSIATDWLRCAGTEVCLRQSMFCDGIINCPVQPHMWTADELGCEAPTQPKYTFMPETTPDKVPAFSLDKIIIFTLIPIMLIIFILGTLAHCTYGKQRGISDTAVSPETPPIEPTTSPTDPPEYQSVIQAPTLQRLESLPPRYETLFPSR